VREAIESVGSETAPSKDRIRTPEGRLRDILNEHLPRGAVTDALVQALYRALDEDQDLPALKADCHLFSSLRTTPLEALIDMIAQQGVRGIITVAAEDEREGRLHIDRGNLHLAEYYGDDEDL